MNDQQRAIVRAKYSSGFLVSESRGIGFIEAIEQAGETAIAKAEGGGA